MRWPPSEATLRQDLPEQEDALFEFKREWYDLSSARGKGEFLKDVLAMANSASADQPGHIVIGVRDQKEGGGVVGVESTPAPEQLAQILSSYTSPAPHVQCSHVPFGATTVSVLRITPPTGGLCAATRECGGVLDPRLVYARRGPTIGALRPGEIADLVRHSDARRRFSPDDRLLDVGFVETGRWGSKITARIANLSEEPVTAVTLLWDVRLPAWPGAFSRSRPVTRSQLGPGESYEHEFDPTSAYYVSPYEDLNVSAGLAVATRWFDVTLHVEYRDRDGFIRQLSQNLSIVG